MNIDWKEGVATFIVVSTLVYAFYHNDAELIKQILTVGITAMGTGMYITSKNK